MAIALLLMKVRIAVSSDGFGWCFLLSSLRLRRTSDLGLLPYPAPQIPRLGSRTEP
jgi:hypothetical protein